MSVAERSFLTVASFTLCPIGDRVLAEEFRSPGSNPLTSLAPLVNPQVNAQNLLTSQPHLAAVEDDAKVPQADASRLNLPSHQTLQQLNIIENSDLANLLDRSSLSTTIDRAAPMTGQQTSPAQAHEPPLAQSLPGSANPPEIDDLVNQIRNSLSPDPQRSSRVAPAISFVTPIGFGGYFGNVGLGVSYQSSTALGNKDDANFGATVSLGNPSQFVGVDLTLAVNSISNSLDRGKGGTLGSDTLSLQVSRLVADDLSIGVGAENLIAFNPSERNISTSLSYYFVGTKIFPLNRDATKPFSTLYTSIGVGNGRFLPAGRVTVQGESGVNVFGSAAVKVIDGINGIVEWSGQDVDLAVSLVPFRNIPLAITPAVVDLIGTNQNRGARFNISLGYSLKF